LKRVLIVASTNVRGGAEFVLQDYLRNNNSHEFFLYTAAQKALEETYGSVLPREAIIVSKYMNLISVRKHPFYAAYNTLRNLLHIHHYVKEKNIEILYGNNTPDMLLLCLYRRWVNRSIRVVLHIHDIVTRAMYLRFIQKFDAYVDAYIVPSQAGKRSIQAVISSKEKIHVIYNGVDIASKGKFEAAGNIRRRYNIPDGAVVLGFVGSISEIKRPDMFIRIVKALNKNNNRYFGLIIGAEAENNWVKYIKRNIDENFLYLGEQERETLFCNIYPIMDVLLLTSDHDTFPTVILEAMANNVLVCAHRVDGVPEMVEDGITGVLWNYDADIDCIVDKIQAVLEDRQKVQYMKEQGELIVGKRFSPQKKRKEIDWLLENLDDAQEK
jgi:glycosyltransferase, group 1